jgi:hypothetical protein
MAQTRNCWSDIDLGILGQPRLVFDDYDAAGIPPRIPLGARGPVYVESRIAVFVGVSEATVHLRRRRQLRYRLEGARRD